MRKVSSGSRTQAASASGTGLPVIHLRRHSRDSRPMLRKSASALSSVDSRPMLRKSASADSRPMLRKSASALSSFSCKSGNTERSLFPSCLGSHDLRPQFNVLVSSEEMLEEVFDFQSKLGEGAFGQVWLCEHKNSGHSYAIKVIDVNSIREVETFASELKVFERLSNPYIVALHEVFRGDSQVYLVMDLCRGGDLRTYLCTYWQDPRRAHFRMVDPALAVGLPGSEVAGYLWQMLAGIAYMHHHRFVHRDIKLANYMLKDAEDPSTIQLCDFGLSTTFRKGELLDSICGTITYMAPEVFKEAYNEKCDIWSIGIVCYMLCLERSPWPSSQDEATIADSILAHDIQPWPVGRREPPSELMDLIDWLLTHDPDLRPGAKEVLERSHWLRRWEGAGPGQQRMQTPKGCCNIS